MWSPKRQEGPTKVVGPAFTVKYVRKNHGTDPTLKGHYVSLFPSFVFLSPRSWMLSRIVALINLFLSLNLTQSMHFRLRYLDSHFHRRHLD